MHFFLNLSDESLFCRRQTCLSLSRPLSQLDVCEHLSHEPWTLIRPASFGVSSPWFNTATRWQPWSSEVIATGVEHQQETFALAALALKSAGAEPKDGIPALAEPKRSEFVLVSSRGGCDPEVASENFGPFLIFFGSVWSLKSAESEWCSFPTKSVTPLSTLLAPTGN